MRIFRAKPNRWWLIDGTFTWASLELLGCRRARTFQLVASASTTDDFQYSITFGLPYLCTIYLSFNVATQPHFLKRLMGLSDRRYGIYADDQSVHFMFHYDWNWHNANEKGISKLFFWERIIKGKSTVTSEPVYSERRSITIPQFGDKYPERQVDVTIVKTNYETKYTRWFPFRWNRWEVISDTPIPVPGKGTTSYNCDENEVISTCFGFGTVNSADEAVEQFIERCKWYRENFPL